MKVAIIGAGLTGLQTALHFSLMEAQVLLLSKPGSLGGQALAWSDAMATTMAGPGEEKVMADKSLPLPISFRDIVFPSLHTFFIEAISNDKILGESELQPSQNRLLKFLRGHDDVEMGLNQKDIFYFARLLIKEIVARGLFKEALVTQVKKQTLLPMMLDQTGQSYLPGSPDIQSPARMRDLFRLHYKIFPDQQVIDNFKNNPDLKDKLDEKTKASLGRPFETFVDVDVVFDCRGKGQSMTMGISGAPVLGERDIPELLREQNLVDGGSNLEKIHYGIPHVEVLKKLQETLTVRQKPWRFTLVGQDFQAALIFNLLARIAEKTKADVQVTVLGLEQSFFPSKRPFVENAIKYFEDKHHLNMEKFRQELAAWEELEDYEKVKIHRPIAPNPKLFFVPKAQIQSLDTLLDRQELFLTYEMPDWTDGKLNLKGPFTLASDFIFVANQRQRSAIAPSLKSEQGVVTEPGYYALNSESTSLKNAVAGLEWALQDLRRFFSKQ